MKFWNKLITGVFCWLLVVCMFLLVFDAACKTSSSVPKETTVFMETVELSLYEDKDGCVPLDREADEFADQYTICLCSSK